jgi:hypothetical protein
MIIGDEFFVGVVDLYFKRCAKLKIEFFAEFQRTELSGMVFSAGFCDNISSGIKYCQRILTFFHLK